MRRARLTTDGIRPKIEILPFFIGLLTGPSLRLLGLLRQAVKLTESVGLY
jgi:hypothetical protein